jgi:hypothetical protein
MATASKEMIHSLNQRICSEEEDTAIQTKGVENLLNEVLAENFPNLTQNIKVL